MPSLWDIFTQWPVLISVTIVCILKEVLHDSSALALLYKNSLYLWFILSGTNRSEMSFEKLSDPAKSTVSDMESYHHSALVNDRIWLFSMKYKEQTKFNWGHRISFNGGYSVYFDIKSKKWSAKQDFAALSNDENLDEALFVFNSQIYLLLYCEFGGIKFNSLYRWDGDGRKWVQINDFKVDASSNMNSKNSSEHCKLVVVKQDRVLTDAIYLISHIDGTTRMHQLSISDNQASLSFIKNVDYGEQLAKHTPIMAARLNDEIYMINGVHGCGFHIEPKKWIGFNLKSKASETIEIQSDAPPFSFVGSRFTSVLPNGLWVHPSGSVQQGMTNSAFNGEVWSVVLSQKPLKWHKNSVVIPKLDEQELVIEIADDGMIYVADNHQGVFATKIEY